MFTQCDVIKNRGPHYSHKVMSSKFGAALFDTASQCRVTQWQFYNVVEFTAKTEELDVGI